MSAGIDFTNFYRDDIFEAGLAYLRDTIPGFSETDLRDPLVALAALDALLHHGEASLIDHEASELSVVDLLLRSSLVDLARTLGQTLTPDTAAIGEVLFDLTGVPAIADELIPTLGLFRTRADTETASIPFENQDGSFTIASALLFTLIVDRVVGGFGAATPTTVASPWPGPNNVNDALYFGHPVMMATRQQVAMTGAPADLTLLLEYYDNEFKRAQPTSAAAAGLGIVFDVSAFLGIAGTVNATSLLVTVKCIPTDVEETVAVVWSGAANTITTVGALGQGAVSTTPGDYELRADWLPADTVNVDISTVPATPYVVPATVFPEGVPQGPDNRWQSTTVNSVTGMWMRLRVVAVAGAPSGPATVSVTNESTTAWVGEVSVSQGRSVADVVGTTTGRALDRFQLSEGPIIEDSLTVLDVGGDTDWTLVDNVLRSGEEDKHYVVEEDPDGSFWVVLPDGTNGFLPAPGLLVTAYYRVGADDNGNVGINTIVEGESPTSFIGNIRNPRQMTGWAEREGNNEDSINALRRLVPARHRYMRRPITVEDHETHAVDEFRVAGAKVIARAIAIEQGAGIKRLRIVCVGPGGTVPSGATMTALQDSFNGTTVALQRFGGVAMANTRVVATAVQLVNYTITVTASIVKKFVPGAADKVTAAARGAVGPLAKDGDGAYRWVPGRAVTDVPIMTAIGAYRDTNDQPIQGIVDLVVTVLPAGALGQSQLPADFDSGSTLTVNIVEVV